MILSIHLFHSSTGSDRGMAERKSEEWSPSKWVGGPLFDIDLEKWLKIDRNKPQYPAERPNRKRFVQHCEIILLSVAVLCTYTNSSSGLPWAVDLSASRGPGVFHRFPLSLHVPTDPLGLSTKSMDDLRLRAWGFRCKKNGDAIWVCGGNWASEQLHMETPAIFSL